MILWTVQTADVFPILHDYFALDCYDDLGFNQYYAMMKDKMPIIAKNLMNINNNPIWCWERYSHYRKYPHIGDDLLPPGVKGVCLKLNVPSEFVLLSQFELWVWIINGWNIPPFNNLEKSFEAIFDLDFGDDEAFGKKSRRIIQAVIPCIKREWVVSYLFFSGSIAKDDEWVSCNFKN